MGKHAGYGLRETSPVVVRMGNGPPIRQPSLFRCCPLGVQFYCHEELPRFKMLGIRLDLAEGRRGIAPVNCAGVVVHSEKANGPDLFRVWVFFLDLPDGARRRLRRLARRSETLCPFCENF